MKPMWPFFPHLYCFISNFHCVTRTNKWKRKNRFPLLRPSYLLTLFRLLFFLLFSVLHYKRSLVPQSSVFPLFCFNVLVRLHIHPYTYKRGDKIRNEKKENREEKGHVEKKVKRERQDLKPVRCKSSDIFAVLLLHTYTPGQVDFCLR